MLHDNSFVDPILSLIILIFHFDIATTTPLTTLIILETSTQHAHSTLRVSLRLAKRPSA
jgi:hypothetical protein